MKKIHLPGETKVSVQGVAVTNHSLDRRITVTIHIPASMAPQAVAADIAVEQDNEEIQ
jgi:hypothetical protein